MSRNDAGFGLVEILVAMVIAAMIITVAGTVVSLLARQKDRSIAATADLREAMAFMRLVDRLFSDVGPGNDALALGRDLLVVTGFGVPRGLAAATEVTARLAREPTGPGASRLAFSIARFDGDSATPGRVEAVLTELESFEIEAEVDGRWVVGSPLIEGAIARIRFAWQRKGGLPRVHDVAVHRGIATACVRSGLARGCSMLVP